MKEEKSNDTNEKFIINNYFFTISDTEELLGVDCTPEVEKKIHQDFLRSQYSMTEPKFPDGITYKNLEELCTNKADYMAMKQLTSMEKFAVFVTAFYPQYIDKLCEDCHISKDGFKEIAKSGANKFLEYRKNHSKKTTKYDYRKSKKFKKNYYKKGGGSNV